MMKVAIVGPIKENAKLGKTNPKIFIYQNAFDKLGYETKLFSTSFSKYKPISLLKSIINSLKFGDTVILMLGGNACRKLIGLFLAINKKYKKRLVLCPFGTGPLNPLLKGKSNDFVNNFIINLQFGTLKDKMMQKKLRRIDLLVAQNNILEKCFKSFYKIDNVCVLRNFRIDIISKNNTNYNKNSVVFISRVVEEKGIVDLVKVILLLNNKNDNQKISLDIYGEMHLKEKNLAFFNKSLESPYIRYHGPVPNYQVQDIISQYSISCLPTKYVGEGTPGFLIESLLAGVPVLVSSFSQVNSIIKDGYDGIVFEIDNIDDLREKMESIIYDYDKINELRKNAFESGKKYTLSYNEKTIKNIIEG